MLRRERVGVGALSFDFDVFSAPADPASLRRPMYSSRARRAKTCSLYKLSGFNELTMHSNVLAVDIHHQRFKCRRVDVRRDACRRIKRAEDASKEAS